MKWPGKISIKIKNRQLSSRPQLVGFIHQLLMAQMVGQWAEKLFTRA